MKYDSDTRWRKLRKQALRRDGYQCRECARYGRHIPAEIVHHAWPVEDWPEYRYRLWNLVSLCSGCHDKIHERSTRQLTASGERWRKKIAPPGSEIETRRSSQLGEGPRAHAGKILGNENGTAGHDIKNQ